MTKKLFSILLMFLLVISINGQTIRYVKIGGTGTGSSWSDSSPDLQAMINASNANDQVWVATGVYLPPINLSFSLKQGVKILGGFQDSGDPVISDRNWFANMTTLKGNGTSVISNTNYINKTALLDGFKITGGNNNGSGMYLNGSSPTIINCVFTANNIEGYGYGTIYSNSSSNPSFINCLFYENSASSSAAVLMNLNSSSPTLINCTIFNNSSPINIIYNNYTSSPKFYNTIILGNSTGIENRDTGSIPIFKNSIMQGVGANVENGNLDGNSITSGTAFLSTDSTNPNFLRLSDGSPLVNKGNNSHYDVNSYGNKDLGFKSRIYSNIDMGVYENQNVALSVSNILNSTIKIYPNPVQYFLTITSKNSLKAVSIYNANGQKIQIPSKIINSKMDMSKLDPGVYLINIIFDGGINESFKVIKK